MVLKLGASNIRPLPPDAGTAAHFPNGQIKLKTEANDHLDRLLAPDTTIPWYRSIFANVGEMLHPEKLLPLELTSRPVSEADMPGHGLWGLYRVNKRSGLVSVAVHVGLFGLLWSITTSPPAVQLARQITMLVAPPAPVHPVEVKPPQGGGGGAAGHSTCLHPRLLSRPGRSCGITLLHPLRTSRRWPWCRNCSFRRNGSEPPIQTPIMAIRWPDCSAPPGTSEPGWATARVPEAVTETVLIEVPAAVAAAAGEVEQATM